MVTRTTPCPEVWQKPHRDHVQQAVVRTWLFLAAPTRPHTGDLVLSLWCCWRTYRPPGVGLKEEVRSLEHVFEEDQNLPLLTHSLLFLTTRKKGLPSPHIPPWHAASPPAGSRQCQGKPTDPQPQQNTWTEGTLHSQRAPAWTSELRTLSWV